MTHISANVLANVLVLGGTGFVGAHVCEKLVQQGYHVTVPTRRRNNARPILHLPGLTVLEANVHDEAALTRLVAGHDAVVNLVAILHGNAAAFDKVHVNLPQKLARACLANGVRRVVQISAIGADDQRPGAAPSEYLRSKGRGEAVLLHPANPADALDVTVLRPSVIFGAEDKFLNLFAKLQKVFPFMPLAGASARFQPVWVQDVATAVVRSLQPRGLAPSGEPHAHASRIYELCGPDVFTLKQLVQLAAHYGVGTERPVIPLPRWLGHIQATLMELAPGEPLMSRDNLASMQQDNVATGTLPGLRALGVEAAALEPIAAQYLDPRRGTAGALDGMRSRHR